ncbi:MAG: hypothetical protein QOD35_3123, partial [Nocardioidaceae bacterium]|nr:hypothetical protein [Nocardioidaceae bacterium]
LGHGPPWIRGWGGSFAGGDGSDFDPSVTGREFCGFDVLWLAHSECLSTKDRQSKVG